MHFSAYFLTNLKILLVKIFFIFYFNMHCNYRDIIFVIRADNLYLHVHNSVTIILIFLSFVNKIFFWNLIL